MQHSVFFFMAGFEMLRQNTIDRQNARRKSQIDEEQSVEHAAEVAAEQQRRQKSKGAPPVSALDPVSVIGVADEPVRALNASGVASQILEALGRRDKV